MSESYPVKEKRIALSKEEKKKVMEKTGGRCAHCGRKLTDETARIEHMVPLSKGGKNDEYNITVLCEGCNTGKSNYLYDTLNYYPYILPEYRENYTEYQSFATIKSYERQLFGADAVEYRGYPPEHLKKIYNAAKISRKKAASMRNMLGIRFVLSKAYPADAKEIMDFITGILENPGIFFDECYYKNEYMVLNDIHDGEVYVLRKAGDTKIHGVYGFKRINDCLGIPQIETIAMNTVLKPRYIMTVAMGDMFAYDCYNSIMEDVIGNLIYTASIPIYLNILGKAFIHKDKCIVMPYQMDKTDVKIEFPTMSYIREMMENAAVNAANEHKYKLSEDELSVYTEMFLKYKTMQEIREHADGDEKKLLESYPKLGDKFLPDTCPLYGNGFGKGEVNG